MKTSPSEIGEIGRKASSALVLSSLSFVIIVVFVIMWIFRKRISRIDKPSVWHCLKRTRKEVQKTRKALAAKRKKGKVAKINVEALDADENPEESHLYATICKNREAPKGKRSRSQTSNDSDSSASDKVIDNSGVVSVELHAYQSVALESYKQSSVLEEMNFHSVRNSTHGSARNAEHVLDQTTGCCIYDVVEGNDGNTPR